MALAFWTIYCSPMVAKAQRQQLTEWEENNRITEEQSYVRCMISNYSCTLIHVMTAMHMPAAVVPCRTVYENEQTVHETRGNMEDWYCTWRMRRRGTHQNNPLAFSHRDCTSCPATKISQICQHNTAFRGHVQNKQKFKSTVEDFTYFSIIILTMSLLFIF